MDNDNSIRYEDYKCSPADFDLIAATSDQTEVLKQMSRRTVVAAMIGSVVLILFFFVAMGVIARRYWEYGLMPVLIFVPVGLGLIAFAIYIFNPKGRVYSDFSLTRVKIVSMTRVEDGLPYIYIWSEEQRRYSVCRNGYIDHLDSGTDLNVDAYLVRASSETKTDYLVVPVAVLERSLSQFRSKTMSE